MQLSAASPPLVGNDAFLCPLVATGSVQAGRVVTAFLKTLIIFTFQFSSSEMLYEFRRSVWCGSAVFKTRLLLCSFGPMLAQYELDRCIPITVFAIALL